MSDISFEKLEKYQELEYYENAINNGLNARTKKPLDSKTKISYITYIRKMRECLDCNLAVSLKDPDLVMKKLNAAFEKSVVKKSLTALQCVIRSNTPLNSFIDVKHWSEIHNKYSYNDKEESSKNDSKGEDWPSYEEILSIARSLNDDEPNQCYDKILLLLYTVVPPQRNDYWKLHLINNNELPETENYLVLDQKMIVLKNYKTFSTYGTMMILLPDEIMKVIHKSLIKNKRKYLFTQRKRGITDKPYKNADSFDDWANRTLRFYIKKNINLTKLRTIFADSLSVNRKGRSKFEQDLISHAMTHSFETHEIYYHSLKHFDVSNNKIIKPIKIAKLNINPLTIQINECVIIFADNMKIHQKLSSEKTIDQSWQQKHISSSVEELIVKIDNYLTEPI